MPNVETIWGFNLPGTSRATSACRGTPLLYYIFAGNFNFLVKTHNFGEGVFKLSVVRLVYSGY